MAKQSPTLYSVSKTFVWFAITSLVLLFSLIAIVLTDYSRDWKTWQKKFILLKTEMTRKELKTTDEKIDKQKLGRLEKETQAAQAAFNNHRADYQRLEKEIEVLNTQVIKAGDRFQGLKQYQDSYKYFFEETRARKDPRAGDYEKKLRALTPRLDKAKFDLEGLEKAKDEKSALLRNFTAKEKMFQKEIDKLLEEKTRVERRLKKIEPTIAKEILNAPMVDFIAPSLQIHQVVLENLQDDYHFTKVQKVDRCATCHLGIDQKGFENASQPFTTHPNLELYLGSNSPHPIEKFGCTVCHGGNGHSVSFKDSAHTPRSEEQKKVWQKKYHWQALEKWDAKMLPMNYAQGSCAKCHQGTVEIPQAEKLNKGRQLAQSYGCFNCHKIKGYEDRWKVGPDLTHVGTKLDNEWIARWLEDPRSFRPSTQMPQIFHLSNTSSPEDRDRNNAVIQAIAAYLMKNSVPITLSKPPIEGDAEKGERLVKEIGCLGCHTAAGVSINHHGPELSNLGSKVTPEWLYHWLKDPKHYSKNTRMPNLRLSDKEAADITHYLLSQRNTSFDQKPIPPAKPKVVDELVLSWLQGTMRRVDAEAELSRMSQDQRLEYLGKKSIDHQGCFGCHTIKGFEDAKPIGTELSNEGRKDIYQLDFGLIEMEHSRQAWFSQKLKEPRIFDKGKVKTYYEKLRMPQFNFTDGEIESLVTFILSLSEESIPLEMQKRLNLKELGTEKGRLLVSKMNCAGCHALDGKLGSLREFTEDKGAAPPALDGEGAKVQEKWLHDFLKKPATIRPWLHTHMPAFDFSEEELNALVEYFANLAHEDVSYQGHELPSPSLEKLATGKMLFEKLQCIKCHQVNTPSAAMGASFLAPDLTLTKKRLKPEWVKKWLNDPQVLQAGTMMPTFFSEGQSPLPDILGGDADKQIEAIRDYLYQYEKDNPEPPA